MSNTQEFLRKSDAFFGRVRPIAFQPAGA